MIGIADLHRTWGTDNYHTHALLQGLNMFTCYEAVEEQLSTYTKARYDQNLTRSSKKYSISIEVLTLCPSTTTLNRAYMMLSAH